MERRAALAGGLSAFGAAVATLGCAAGPRAGTAAAPVTPVALAAGSREDLVRQVTAAETAFARTMADRDHAAFTRFVADDAVFLNGGQPLRGKAAIAAHWQRFFTAATAPFAWQPERVEVIGSGTLAQTTGPVSAPGGKVIARFYSTWRLEPGGQWRVVLDDGYDVVECSAK